MITAEAAEATAAKMIIVVAVVTTAGRAAAASELQAGLVEARRQGFCPGTPVSSPPSSVHGFSP